METEKRLIDAFGFRERLNQAIKSRKKAGLQADVLIVASIIAENCPTVDAVEVVHGRWIRRHNETKCSECGFIYYSMRADYSYCPNCGAKMDGGKQ